MDPSELTPTASAIDGADTAWMIAACAMVLLMTPALAFFYGGLVRSKNALNTMMMSFAALGTVGVTWALFGYSLAFAPGNAWIGDLSFAFLNGVGLEANGSIPHLLFMAFQGTFAILTAALISGAIAERMRFGAYLLFINLWMLLVYAPVCHWVWGNGWLAKLGALDFAGGTVVHVNAGAAAVVAALVLGPRRDYARQALLPHNVPFVLLGAGLLWFGWFGFNAGSALSAGGLAASAFVTTNTAAAAATLAWMAMDWLTKGKPTALGAASGLVAGLVAITPAAGFVTPLAAIAIGALGGVGCFSAVSFRAKKTGIDDSLDVFGVHGVGGTLGALATGVFAWTAINPAGFDGLLHGNPKQLGIQALAVLITWVYSAGVTFVLLKVIDAVMGLRVTSEGEEAGLDVDQHRESAYSI
jgi:Amt family ammonium transporter